MNQEHMDSISLEKSHVLGNEGGQCLAKCALIYLTPKYSPPLSCPPLRIIQNFG